MSKDLRMLTNAAAILTFGTFCFFCGGGVFVFVYESRKQNENYIYELDISNQIISEDPAFSKVEVHQYSGGGVWYSGSIDNPDDYRRFENKVRLAFGKKRADWMFGGLSGRPNETAPTNRK